MVTESVDTAGSSTTTYHKSRVDLLQDLLLDENHSFTFALLDALLLQLLAGVHLARGSDLTSAHLPESAFAQNSVHPKSLVRHRLTING